MIAITLLHTIFNYTIAVFPSRLSRARRVVENAFGILAMKWRIFRTEIEAQPKFLELYICESMLSTSQFPHRLK